MFPSRYATALLLLTLPLLFAVLRVKHHQEATQDATQVETTRESTKQVIGPVVTLTELESSMKFTARVDTGAKRCSLHSNVWTIEGESPAMEENVGKTIRFLVENRQGESVWLRRKIVEVVLVRTSEISEWRYLVPITFRLEDFEREVMVSLNDRSRMSYAMLLGRNFLKGKYAVDVELGEEEQELLLVQR